MNPKTPVSFKAPNGLVNTGVILNVVDGVAAVAVDVPIVTFPIGELTEIKEPAAVPANVETLPGAQPPQPPAETNAPPVLTNTATGSAPAAN